MPCECRHTASNRSQSGVCLKCRTPHTPPSLILRSTCSASCAAKARPIAHNVCGVSWWCRSRPLPPLAQRAMLTTRGRPSHAIRTAAAPGRCRRDCLATNCRRSSTDSSEPSPHSSGSSHVAMPRREQHGSRKELIAASGQPPSPRLEEEMRLAKGKDSASGSQRRHAGEERQGAPDRVRDGRRAVAREQEQRREKAADPGDLQNFVQAVNWPGGLAAERDVGRCGELWGEMARDGEIWRDTSGDLAAEREAGRCGERWREMARDGEIRLAAWLQSASPVARTSVGST